MAVSTPDMDAGSGGLVGKRALIRTLPLEHGNYGSVLQAYALQCALRDLMVCAETDLSVRRGLSSRLVSCILPAKQLVSRRPIFRREINALVQAALNDFIYAHIATTRLFTRSSALDFGRLRGYDALIVGGDQVWREDYGDVGSYLLDFLPSAKDWCRIAYAASFGTEDSVVLDKLRRFRPLAQRFDYVSVREDWAVSVCSDIWEVEATQVLDPVLLLPPRHYQNLISGADGFPLVESCGVFGFFLDPTTTKLAATELLASRLDLPSETYTPPATPTLREFRRERSRFEGQLSMEEWLSRFDSASVVVTDSFHGVALSILLNRPFIAVGNQSRGLGRFGSLLRLFGLDDHLRVDAPDYGELPSVSWPAVNRKIASERRRSMAFLARAVCWNASDDAQEKGGLDAEA